MSDLARQLLAGGLVAGDVVAAIGGNSREAWRLLRATEDAGLVLAIFNHSWSPLHLNRLVQNLGPRLVVGYGSRHNKADDLIGGWVHEDGNLEFAQRGIQDRFAPSGLSDSVEGAIVFCTSGSTGDPKCIVSSPQNRSFSASTISRYLGLSRGQCIINALSPSFDYGFYQGLMAHAFDLDMQLIESPQMTGEILSRIRNQKRIVLPLTPALAARLVRALAPGEKFPQVEIVTLTGGATAMGLRQGLKQTFPFAKIFAMYGLTECKRVAYLPPEEFLECPLSCGREMPGVEAEILDSEGRPLAQGGVGELVVRGDNVCLGYWGDPDATARRFKRNANDEVTLFTGDSFRRDAHGRLEFVCRHDDLVKLRDERVSLGAIESELRRSKLVLDIALDIATDSLGIPLLHAKVVPRDHRVTEAELLRSFRRVVSRAGHLPHEVIVIPEIALNTHGKHAKLPPAVNSGVQLSLVS